MKTALKITDEPRHFRLISCNTCPTDAVCYGISPLAPKVFPATKQLVQRLPNIRKIKERKETVILTVRLQSFEICRTTSSFDFGILRIGSD